MYQKNWKPLDGKGLTKKRTVQAVERGPYWLATLTTENYLAPQFKGFTVEVLGMPYTFEGESFPYPVFGDLFGLKFIRLRPGKGGVLDITFDSCRITHERSSLDIRVHWHDGWNRNVSISGYSFDMLTDFDKIKLALSLFKHTDKRGKGERFNSLEVTREIQKLQEEKHPEITVDLLAARLGKTKTGLNKWMEIESYTVDGLCRQARELTEASKRMEEFKAKRKN
jgi:hypothetical protein